MGTPSTPGKQVRVSPHMHERLTTLAEHLNGTVDDAVRWLFQRENLIRVQASEQQKERWAVKAREAGMDLPDFVAACTESAVQNGMDRGGMMLMYQHIREIRAILRAAEQRGNIPSGVVDP
jgi:hypothetical protein